MTEKYKLKKTKNIFYKKNMFSFSKLNLQDKYILLKEEEISIHNTNFHEMLKLQTSDVNNSSVHLCFFFFSVLCGAIMIA